MEEKTLLKKQNITLFSNSKIVGGVIDFNIKKVADSTELYEFLQSQPWKILNVKTSYVITIKQVSGEFVQLDCHDLFAFIGKKRVRFTNCTTSSFDISFDSSGRLVTTTAIYAEGMVV
jgi:hypothetical protein